MARQKVQLASSVCLSNHNRLCFPVSPWCEAASAVRSSHSLSQSDGRRCTTIGGDHKVRNNAMKMRNNAVLSRFPAAVGSTLLLALLGSPSVAEIISDWSTAAAPPPPELKEVAIDPSTTALLFLDIMK